MKIDTDLFKRFKDGKCSPVELELLRRYFEQSDLTLLDKDLLEEWDQLKPQAIDESVKVEIWNRLSQPRNSKQTAKIFSFRKKLIRYAASAAAILLLLFTGSYFWKSKGHQPLLIERINRTNLPMVLQLEDGSKINLQPNSQLVYYQPFLDTLRKVSLTGEARFEVASDAYRPFIVETEQLQTSVLGTVFNVKALPNQDISEVTLFEGKVAVKPLEKEQQKAIVLNPGEQAEYQKSKQILTKNNSLNQAAFQLKDRFIVFERANIEEVVKALEAWYGITIQIKNKEEITETLVHRIDTKKMSIQEVLEGITLVANYQFKKITTNEYLVISKE